MIYDWIKNRNRFRVETHSRAAANKILQMVMACGGSPAFSDDGDKTFIRDIEGHPDLFVLYITPLNRWEKGSIENTLDNLKTITG